MELNRILNLIEWTLAFEEFNDKKVNEKEKEIQLLIDGAIENDKFAIEVVENQYIVYPCEIEKATINIKKEVEIYKINTTQIWKEIDKKYTEIREFGA